MSFLSPVPRPDAPVLPRSTGRRMRVVVAGEFKSGKSSVINALLRQPVLPMQSRQASRPAFLLRHAPEAAGLVCLHDGAGRTRTATALDEATDFAGAGLCEVAVAAPHLDGVELVELPFPCDGEVGAEAIALMAGADLLIWVSIASQAWRLSEKAILTRLPPMRGRSVIVLSRADKLRCAADWDRIEERVQREAGPWFSAVAFVQAARETIRASQDDDHAWESSGGKILAELVADRRRRFSPDSPPRPLPAAVAVTPVGPAQPEPEVVAPASVPAPVAEPPVPPVGATAVQAVALQLPSPPAAVQGSPAAADCVLPEIEQVAASLGGLLCGGLVRLADSACLAAFGADRDRVSGLAPGLVALLAGSGTLGRATGQPVGEAAIRLGPSLLVAVPVGAGDEAAFLLLRNDSANLLLVRTALRRIVGLWVGRD